jgi:hypothetical protein
LASRNVRVACNLDSELAITCLLSSVKQKCNNKNYCSASNL